ncbi:hypothetical protein FNV43_RR08740 [Rhamnella rubrinervis]|uniref:Uncharacterized protein n=1 Tax=Rhamnella rubrinervis TaxID=2594499 RepID=A0A8K0H8V9_9ROSA|nr:hypothetical protein FNV43_RR08740 [Rhamnella rubrinervis]
MARPPATLRTSDRLKSLASALPSSALRQASTLEADVGCLISPLRVRSTSLRSSCSFSGLWYELEASWYRFWLAAFLLRPRVGCNHCESREEIFFCLLAVILPGPPGKVSQGSRLLGVLFGCLRFRVSLSQRSRDLQRMLAVGWSMFVNRQGWLPGGSRLPGGGRLGHLSSGSTSSTSGILGAQLNFRLCSYRFFHTGLRCKLADGLPTWLLTTWELRKGVACTLGFRMVVFKTENGVSGGTNIDVGAHPPTPKSGIDPWKMINNTNMGLKRWKEEDDA